MNEDCDKCDGTGRMPPCGCPPMPYSGDITWDCKRHGIKADYKHTDTGPSWSSTSSATDAKVRP